MLSIIDKTYTKYLHVDYETLKLSCILQEFLTFFENYRLQKSLVSKLVSLRNVKKNVKNLTIRKIPCNLPHNREICNIPIPL